MPEATTFRGMEGHPELVGPPRFPATGMVAPEHWNEIPADEDNKRAQVVETGPNPADYFLLDDPAPVEEEDEE